MIRVEQKSLGEYLFKREQNLIKHTNVSIFDARRNLCTPGFIALIFGIGFLVFSFFSRVALLLLLTELASLFALYFYTLSIARRLTLRRLLPTKPLREMDTAEVVVELRNKSSWDITGLIVEDRFFCAKDFFVKAAPDRISPRAMIRFAYKRICDGGMGKHRVGPLKARVTDPLGIFEFRVVEDTISEVEIYPKIEKVPTLPVRASIDGMRYGNYEVNGRGLSVNFSGVRPYESGDSLRHIAWKLSTRGQGLLVKEFEKVVSCDVSIVLNLAPQWQVGRHSSSTWESAKDVALTVIEQQLELGNTVGFFSDQSLVEPGVGNDHFHSLARHIAGLSRNADQSESMELFPPCLLGKYQDLFLRGSNVIYITPFNTGEVRQSEKWLKRLAADGHHVICIFIDTNSYWMQFIESISTGLIIGAKLMQGLDEIVYDLKRSGVQAYVVKNRQPLREALA